ncbi:hypothetical protein [uncultured Algibacter sp.]|uniref:hypothetical protein n=1 Tax=uncultured Algibacter sp. TaxID=298659 RepID=UPI002636545A|nr:hypothetical protein [uncultured Algibacter sp.]
MIDINKLEGLFFEKLGDGYIKHTSLYTSNNQNNYFEICKDKLIEGVEYIIYREWFVRPILTFDFDKMVGEQISVEEFLGSHFDINNNSLILSGQKQWTSEYFSYPYDENFKKRLSKSERNYNTPYGLSSCFDLEKNLNIGGNFRGSNFDLNEIFLNIKSELLDKEQPLIFKWNNQWINVYGFEFDENDEAIWTLFYPRSELTIIIFPIMQI